MQSWVTTACKAARHPANTQLVRSWLGSLTGGHLHTDSTPSTGAAPWQPEGETLGTRAGHPVGTAAPGARGERTREAGCADSTLRLCCSKCILWTSSSGWPVRLLEHKILSLSQTY